MAGAELRPRLRVLVADERGRPLRAAALTAWLRRVAPGRARGTVSIALVSDGRIRALNRRYRRRDVTTDVLSFAAAAARRRSSNDNSDPDILSRPSNRFLGDIVIARGVARRQARAARHSELAELKVLALHGLLHLLGHDHHADDGAMARIERRLRRKGGLREGLIERARPAARSAR
jgi:probable rRNA maturation factor